MHPPARPAAPDKLRAADRGIVAADIRNRVVLACGEVRALQPQGFAYELAEDLRQRAVYGAWFEWLGLGAGFTRRLADEIDRVGAEDVRRAARRYLANPSMVIVAPAGGGGPGTPSAGADVPGSPPAGAGGPDFPPGTGGPGTPPAGTGMPYLTGARDASAATTRVIRSSAPASTSYPAE